MHVNIKWLIDKCSVLIVGTKCRQNFKFNLVLLASFRRVGRSSRSLNITYKPVTNLKILVTTNRNRAVLRILQNYVIEMALFCCTPLIFIPATWCCRNAKIISIRLDSFYYNYTYRFDIWDPGCSSSSSEKWTGWGSAEVEPSATNADCRETFELDWSVAFVTSCEA